MSVMRVEEFFAASAARKARFLTSSATTANPAPASPARAASTAALSASRFVWKEISSIVLTIFWVSSLAPAISRIDTVSLSIEAFAFSMVSMAPAINALAFAVPAALLLVIDDISSREEEVSSMEAACSDAASERIWEVSTAPPTASPIFRRIVSTDWASSPISSVEVNAISCVRSPSAIRWITSIALRTGPVMIFAISRLSRIDTPMAIARTKADSIREALNRVMELS